MNSQHWVSVAVHSLVHPLTTYDKGIATASWAGVYTRMCAPLPGLCRIYCLLSTFKYHKRAHVRYQVAECSF